MDNLVISPTFHLVTGTVVLLTSPVAMIAVGLRARKNLPMTGIAQISFILFQLALMLQALVGIKLLDQGLGGLQIYVHYLGGLAPLAFALVYYWLRPANEASQSRWAAVVTVASFVFALLTFTVGSMYVA
jgi:hypothetical protein